MLVVSIPTLSPQHFQILSVPAAVIFIPIPSRWSSSRPQLQSIQHNSYMCSFTSSLLLFLVSSGNSAHSFTVMPTYDKPHCKEIDNQQKICRSHSNTAGTQPCSRGITAESVPIPAVIAIFWLMLFPFPQLLPSSPSPCSPLICTFQRLQSAFVNVHVSAACGAVHQAVFHHSLFTFCDIHAQVWCIIHCIPFETRL